VALPALPTVAGSMAGFEGIPGEAALGDDGEVRPGTARLRQGCAAVKSPGPPDRAVLQAVRRALPCYFLPARHKDVSL